MYDPNSPTLQSYYNVYHCYDFYYETDYGYIYIYTGQPCGT